MDEHKILGKKIMVLTAHPDDESFAAAGTVHKNWLAGGSASVICATLGERGISHLPKSIAKSKVKAMRKKELLRATRFMGAKLHYFNFPDGSLRKFQKEFFLKSLVLAKRERPDLILGFDKDGISGHLDHIAAGAVAKKIAKKLKIRIACFCLPPRYVRNHAKWIGSRRQHGKYIGIHRMKHATPNLRISIDPIFKKKTIKFHSSQLDKGKVLSSLPSHVRAKWLKYEYFHIYE